MAQLSLLHGVNVVDRGCGMPTSLAAKFLAGLGAQVIRIPPAAGSEELDAEYPFLDVWRRPLTLNQSAAEDSVQRDKILGAADLLILEGESHPACLSSESARELAERFPRLVILSIEGYPEGTSDAGRPASDLLVQARSGLVWEQFPDRPALMGFQPACYGAALHGLIGALAALFERETSGRGQIVSTSLLEGALAWVAIYWAELEKGTPAADFVIPRGAVPLIFRCRDDVYINLVLGSAGSKYGVYQALGIEDPSVLPSDSGMPKAGGSPRNFFGEYDLLARHAAMKDSGEILEAVWARGLPGERVLPPGACWDDPQIVRNAIVDTDADGVRHVGLPLLAKANPATGVDRWPTSGSRPLDGVKVVDCGAFVAGPLASVILADLGAEVVKVEALSGDPNRAIFKAFSFANRGKLGLAIDLKNPNGQQAVHNLCMQADIVCNNFRPGVSARLGVDPKSLHAGRPDLVVLESPAYGSEGPMAAKAGFDMAMQAWCGHALHATSPGAEPLWNRTNPVDICGGMLGAVAMLAGLLYRRRSGNGVALESSLVNAGIFLLSELVQETDGSFRKLPEMRANLCGRHPAESLYEAADCWVAIQARGPAACRHLREQLGMSLELPVNREAWDERHAEAIARAVKQRKAAELAALLEPHGVWVEPCPTDSEARILHDPALVARGSVRIVRHPTFGAVRELAALVHFSRSATGNDIPAPLLGGSSVHVLQELGCSSAEIDALVSEGVVQQASVR